MKEITFSEIQLGKRYRVQTIGRGYAYRFITKEWEGVAVSTRRDSVTNTPIVRLALDNGKELSLFNLFGIWEA